MTKLEEIAQYRSRQQTLFMERQQLKLKRTMEKHETMLQMAKLHQDEGLSYSEIGKKFGISRQRVHQLLKEFIKDA